jgi:hypothetical protein
LRTGQDIIPFRFQHQILRRTDGDRIHDSGSNGLHAHGRIPQRDNLERSWTESFGAHHLFAGSLIRTQQSRNAKSLTGQSFNVFDFRTDDQRVFRLFHRNENKLYREPALKDATQGAAEGRGKIQITVQHGYRAETRIDLNQLRIEPLLFKEAFLQGNPERRD